MSSPISDNDFDSLINDAGLNPAQVEERYAKLLAEKMEHHQARCILLNTGWQGGPFGVGKRISIRMTRALLNAALNGDLDKVPTDAVVRYEAELLRHIRSEQLPIRVAVATGDGELEAVGRDLADRLLQRAAIGMDFIGNAIHHRIFHSRINGELVNINGNHFTSAQFRGGNAQNTASTAQIQHINRSTDLAL